MGTNTSDIEVRPHRDGARASTLDANTQTSLPIVDVMLPSGGGDQLAIPQINLSISGYEPDSLRDSHIRSPATRAQEILIMPQLDGPVSLLTRDPFGRRVRKILDLRDKNIPKEVHMYKEPPYHEEGNIQENAAMMIMLIEDHIGIRNPLKEGDIPVKVEGHLIEEYTWIEDLLGESIPIEMEGLPEEDDILEEDPLRVEGPLMEMEDPLMVEDPLDLLVDEDHQALKDPLGQGDL